MSSVRTITRDPFKYAPRLDNVVKTVEAAGEGEPNQVCFFSEDRRTVYGVQWEKLTRSTDNGASWQNVAAPSLETLRGAWMLPNGEVLVTSKVGGGKGGLHLSKGFPANETGATWSKVLTVSQNDNRIHEAWGLSYAPKGHPREGLVVATEYGGQGGASTPADSGASKVWVSTDYAKTWRQVFSLFPFTGVSNQQHMHGVAYDPHDDRLLASFGDGRGDVRSKTGVIACENFLEAAPTWTYVDGPRETAQWQVTTILPLPNGVLLGGDGTPPGIWRLPRLGYRRLGGVQVVLNYGGGTDAGWIGQRMFQHAAGQPVIISHEFAKSDALPACVHITLDGVTFTELYREDAAWPWAKMSLVGPSATGRVFGWSNDTRSTTGRYKVTADLVLEPDPGLTY